MSTAQIGHGRRTTRTIRVVQAPAWIEFEGTTQVAQLWRTTRNKGKRSVKVVYLATSAGLMTCRCSSWPVGPRPLGHREQASLGSQGDVRRRPLLGRGWHHGHVTAAIRNTVITVLRFHDWDNLAQPCDITPRTPTDQHATDRMTLPGLWTIPIDEATSACRTNPLPRPSPGPG